MGRKLKETTTEERKIILNMRENGSKLHDIAKTVQRSVSTVQSIIKRCQERCCVENKARRGRPEKLNNIDKRQILRQVKKDPQVSAPKIVIDLIEAGCSKVSPDTVRRVIHKYGYKKRVARKKPFVSLANRQKRIHFAKMYINKDEEFWKTVLFSDETKFNIMRSGGQVRVWRRRNAELCPKNMAGTVKHGGGSVTLWGYMAASGAGRMQFIDGIMDQYYCINILKDNLL